ncbi:hypothetical protein [Microbacterium sp. A93]|uniref:hypothetical protein n=1 Tax=Microbacterium sp. A93 TaxID=3450716 RepID=UPI003F437C6A
MATDPIDALLDTSAPARQEIATADVRGMIMDARAHAQPSQPRAKKAALVTGVLALLMAGGAGVAVATDLFPWTAAQQDPYVSVSYTLPSGLSCEQRLFLLDADDPAAAEWLKDFAAENDLFALSNVDGYLGRMKTWEQPQPTGDAGYWAAVSGAVWETVLIEAERAGFASDALTGEQSQTFCADGNGDVVFPR